MEPWIWWAIGAAGLLVAEIITGGALVFAMLAGGAVIAAVIAGATGSLEWSLAGFAIASLLGLVGVRPLARRHMKQSITTRTGVAALVGTTALVVEPVDGRDGRIKLAGEVWSARAFDGDSRFEPGDTVYVLQIEGATALVAH